MLLETIFAILKEADDVGIRGIPQGADELAFAAGLGDGASFPAFLERILEAVPAIADHKAQFLRLPTVRAVSIAQQRPPAPVPRAAPQPVLQPVLRPAPVLQTTEEAATVPVARRKRPASNDHDDDEPHGVREQRHNRTTPGIYTGHTAPGIYFHADPVIRDVAAFVQYVCHKTAVAGVSPPVTAAEVHEILRHMVVDIRPRNRHGCFPGDVKMQSGVVSIVKHYRRRHPVYHPPLAAGPSTTAVLPPIEGMPGNDTDDEEEYGVSARKVV